VAERARDGRFVIVDTDRHNLPYLDVGFASHEEAERERDTLLQVRSEQKPRVPLCGHEPSCSTGARVDHPMAPPSGSWNARSRYADDRRRLHRRWGAS
jgi:hypothetical protein